MSTVASETLPARPDADRPQPGWTRARAWNWAVLGLTVAGFAVLAWNRRWMSDDGMIVLRTVRQILAGNGPVFNAGERVESNTSTLWTFLLLAFAWIPGLRLEWLAVVTGLVCSVGGLLLALDGARRLAGATRSVFVVPLGALVVVTLPPFRDFATSGLETGLITLWLGGTWWLLVRRARHQSAGRVWLTAVVIGLGYLVRPDLALFSAVAGVGLLVLAWRGWRAGLLWIVAAAALPAAYQVFRMGYYGLLTPNTALVKEASNALWHKGFGYLADFVGPYWLWVPVVLCALIAVALLWGKRVNREIAVVVAVPVLAALGLALYVIRVGGDFMHARMLLPALFCLLLPVMAIRLTRLTVVPAIALGAWALVAVGWLRTPYTSLPHPIDEARGIADERANYVADSHHTHPILAEDFDEFTAIATPLRTLLDHEPEPVVLVQTPQGQWHAYPTTSGHDTVTFFNIGGPGLLLPLDVWVHDPIGLSNPIAAHTTPYPDRRTGHNKYAGIDWDLADGGRGTTAELAARGDFTAVRLDDIRRTLACPHNREMLDSVRAPLTFERFWDNLVHAVGRTSLRYDHDPAKNQTCG
ncbi:arabinofuranosyltransferase [Amycolatopsis sp. NBC_01480]|uniref:arabinofuranosyltransferase n=1 Tax=Amycolatopsis sp. NBC_01480 TaxID=2903562 RepID=UPI002E29447D|nr:arabinofuranosyltransferase [Amycolatopsis sp. NBC_01480]